MIDSLFSIFEIEIIARIAMACVCGFTVGYERTKHQKSAGVRTYIIVALGATIFTIASKYGFLSYIGDGRRVDVARVACNIVTGVSFLGAGTITLRSDRVTGLTTAAGIWVMSAIGMALGAGMYRIALIATLMVMFVQNLFHEKRTRRFHAKVPGRVDIVMDDTEKTLNKVLAVFEDYDMEVDETLLKRRKDDFLSYSFRIQMSETVSVVEVVNDLSAIKAVQSVDM